MWGRPPRPSGQTQRDLQLVKSQPGDFLVKRQTTLDQNYLSDSTANIYLQKWRVTP
jgi:hypothetical protein